MASDQLMICVAPELLDRKHSGQNPGGKRATSQEQSHSLLGLYKLWSSVLQLQLLFSSQMPTSL